MLRNRRLVIGSLILVLGIFFLVQLCEPSQAATITVDDNGDADYTSIEDAVTAANDLDTILVYSGYYRESLVIGQPLTIIGNGSDSTFIDGAGSVTAIRIAEDGCSFTGFTIFNSTRGIKIDGNNADISYVNCSGNSEDGILVNQGDDHSIANSTCASNGRNGIMIDLSVNTVIENTTCSNNSDDGLTLRYADSTMIEYSTFDGNGDNGINFVMESNDVTIQHCTITSNSIGVLVQDDSARAALIHNRIMNNNAYGINALDNDDEIVNATRNFWGDQYGPYHADNNRNGPGNPITEYVEFLPWVNATYHDMYFDLAISVSDNVDGAKPDEFVEFPITIENIGTLSESFTLTSIGHPSSFDVLFSSGDETSIIGAGNSSMEDCIVLVTSSATTGTYYFNVSIGSRSNPDVIRYQMFKIIINPEFSVTTDIDIYQLEIFPVSNKSVDLNVKNTGPFTDYFKITVSNVDGVSVSVNPVLTMDLGPDESSDVLIDFYINGGQGPKTVTFSITITSMKADEEGLVVSSNETIDVTIMQVYRANIADGSGIFSVHPDRDNDGEKTFQLNIENKGTGEDTFSFEFGDDNSTSIYKSWVTLPNSITLGAGAASHVTFQITVPPFETSPIARVGQYDVDILVFSQNARTDNVETEETTDDFLCTVDVKEYRYANFHSVIPDSTSMNVSEIAYVNVSFQNLGNGEERYVLKKDGEQPGNQNTAWFDFNRSSVTLQPLETVNLIIILQPPIDAEAGIHVFEFHAESETVYDTETEEFTLIVNETFGGEFLSGDTQSGSPGSTVTFDITVHNSGNSRNNFQLHDPILPDMWTYQWNSGNQQYLDPASSHIFNLRIDIPIDRFYSHAGTYEFITTGVMGASGGGEVPIGGTARLTVNVNTIFDVRMQPETVGMEGKPGDSVNFQFEIENRGNRNDTYQFLFYKVDGLDDARDWIVDLGLGGGDQLTLLPFQFHIVNLTVQIPEFNVESQDAEAGSYGFRVKAKSIIDTDVEAEVTCELEVKPIYGLEVWIHNAERHEMLSAGEDLQLFFSITVLNTGNSEHDVSLFIPEGENTGVKANWEILFGSSSQNTNHLGSYQQDTETLSVVVNNATPAGNYTIRVLCESHHDPSILLENILYINLTRAEYDVQLERTDPENPMINPSEGGSHEFKFTITNPGKEDDVYTLEIGTSTVSGAYKGWSIWFENKAEQHANILNVPYEVPGQSDDHLVGGKSLGLSLYILIPSKAGPGYYSDILITATSQGNPLIVKVLQFDLTIVRSNIRVGSSEDDLWISPSSGIRVGGDIDIHTRIYNDGSTGTGTFYLFFYNGASNSPEEELGFPIERTEVENIQAHSYSDVSVTWDEIPAGKNDIFVYADKPIRVGSWKTEIDGQYSNNGHVIESSEIDNYASISPIFHDALDLRPDLTVQSVEFGELIAGEKATIIVTVVNVGTALLPSGEDTNIRVYIEDEASAGNPVFNEHGVVGGRLFIGDDQAWSFFGTLPEEPGNYTMTITIAYLGDRNPDNNTNVLNVVITGSTQDEPEETDESDSEPPSLTYLGTGLIIGFIVGFLLLLLILRSGARSSSDASDQEGPIDPTAPKGNIVYNQLVSLIAPSGPNWDGASDFGPEAPSESFAPPGTPTLAPGPSSSFSSASSALSSESDNFSCPKCGVSINPHSMFCIGCGAHVNTLLEPTPETKEIISSNTFEGPGSESASPPTPPMVQTPTPPVAPPLTPSQAPSPTPPPEKNNDENQ